MIKIWDICILQTCRFAILTLGNVHFWKYDRTSCTSYFVCRFVGFFQKQVIILENLHDETNAYLIQMCKMNSFECNLFLWKYVVPHCRSLSKRLQICFLGPFCRQIDQNSKGAGSEEVTFGPAHNQSLKQKSMGFFRKVGNFSEILA